MKLIRKEQEDYYFDKVVKIALKKKKAEPFSDEFYAFLEQKDKVIASLIRNSNTSGYCYFYSLLLAKLMPGSVRNKGILQSLTSNVDDCYMDYFYHAFVEKNGLVYDTTSKMVFDKDFYYEYYGVRVDETIPSSDLEDEERFKSLLKDAIKERPILEEKLKMVTKEEPEKE